MWCTLKSWLQTLTFQSVDSFLHTQVPSGSGNAGLYADRGPLSPDSAPSALLEVADSPLATFFARTGCAHAALPRASLGQLCARPKPVRRAALVTGGDTGLGLAAVQRLLCLGYRVSIR